MKTLEKQTNKSENFDFKILDCSGITLTSLNELHQNIKGHLWDVLEKNLNSLEFKTNLEQIEKNLKNFVTFESCQGYKYCNK